MHTAPAAGGMPVHNEGVVEGERVPITEEKMSTTSGTPLPLLEKLEAWQDGTKGFVQVAWKQNLAIRGGCSEVFSCNAQAAEASQKGSPGTGGDIIYVHRSTRRGVIAAKNKM